MLVSNVISNPLVNRLLVNCEGPQPYSVHVKYEGLNNFCYYCGILSHEDRDCAQKFEDEREGMSVETVQRLTGYGPGMRTDHF